MEEGPSVLSVRSAVDLEHCRVHAIRVVTRRFEHPSLELPSVRSCEVVLLRLGDVAVVQPRIQVRDPSLGTVREHEELTRITRIRGAERQHPRGGVEVIDSSLSAGLLTQIAFEVHRLDGCHAGSASQEVDALTRSVPADPGRVARPHVVDDRVGDSQVEAGGQAVWAAPGQRHDPEPLQQTDVEPVGRDESDLVSLGRPYGRAEVKASPETHPGATEVDEVQVELALQVGAGFGVAGHHQSRAVRRPVEVRDVPGAARQLFGLAAGYGDDEQVVIAAVDVT